MSLRSLLDDGARHDAEYADGLSNHLPMALLALHALGAPEARLAAFASQYAERLVPAPAAEPWPAGEAWPSRFGDRAAWPAYRSLFTDWIVWEGADAVLSQVVPVLMPGCGAAAFHGLIRTACAVLSEHEAELADGLAYWACRYLDLGPLPAHGDEADPAVVLGDLQRLFGQRPFKQRLIVERMADTASAPGFRDAAARLHIDDATLPLLARQAASRYAQSGNFTALHLVTSAHAVRVLMPWCEAAQDALRAYWLAYAAGFAASGLAANPPSTGLRSDATWDEIRAAAIASDNDHTIKLVFACRQEIATTGDERCRIAAARAAFG